MSNTYNEYDLPKTVVGGFPTVRLSRAELAHVMVTDCMRSRNDRLLQPKLVFSSNGQGLALADSRKGFAEIMGAADIIHADGQSVVIASKLTKYPLPERIATTDFFHDAADAAIISGLSFYILGGTESQNASAVSAINRRYPNLKIVGRRNGYFKADEAAAVCADIVASGADVLWVGLGKPYQEEWCVENRDLLRGVGWVKTCGGLYSFLNGTAPRAPSWMRDAGLEWLYRLGHDPRRLARRYAVTNFLAAKRLLMQTGSSSSDR